MSSSGLYQPTVPILRNGSKCVGLIAVLHTLPYREPVGGQNIVLVDELIAEMNMAKPDDTRKLGVTSHPQYHTV